MCAENSSDARRSVRAGFAATTLACLCFLDGCLDQETKVVAANSSRCSITIYSDVSYLGEQASFRESQRDLEGTGLNDRLSSARIRTGKWTFYRNADFTGRALSTTDDIPDIHLVIGGEPGISSMRCE